MKKHLLSLLLFFSCLTAFSQEFETYESRTVVFARAGLNYSGTVGWEGEGAGRMVGFMGGIGLISLIDGPGKYRLNVGAEFSQQGLAIEEPINSDDVSEMKLNYINLPAYITYMPFGPGTNFYVGAGPQLGFRVGGHAVTKDGQEVTLNDDKFEGTAWDAIGVMGFHFANHGDWGIQFRYQHGLSKVFVDAPKVRHSVFQVSLVFPIDILSAMFPSEEEQYYY